jgi:hypothetical protein
MERVAGNEAAAAVEAETVDALLGDLEVGADEAGVVIEELDAATESAVEAEIAKSEAYEEQPVEATSVEAPAPAAEKPAKEKKERAPKAPRELSALDASAFQLLDGDVADDDNKAKVIGLRPSQKKIGEKFDNLFQSIAAGKKPSTYTVACFNALAAAKTVSQTDLVAALRAATVSAGKTKGGTYNEGTARSQAGQMMALFSVVGIAHREKQTLTLNEGSALVAKLKAIIS